MKKKSISGIMLTLFLASIFTSTFSIQLIKAETVVVMFDEAHLPNYSVGTNPVAGGGTVGAYSEFSKILEGAGFTVKTLDPGGSLSSTLLKDVCILIITAGALPYSSSELSAIDDFVKGGKGLLLIGENSIITAEVEPIANLFGASFDGLFEVDSIADPTDYTALKLWIILDKITAHPVTSGVTEVEVYAASTVSSPGALITTDEDAYWYHSNKPVPFQPVLTVMAPSSGRVAIIGDATLWTNFDLDGDGDLNIYDRDNEILALNTIQWLSRTRALWATVCSVWTTDSDGNPKVKFDQGEMVYVHWNADGVVDMAVYALLDGATIEQEWTGLPSSSVNSFVPYHGNGIYEVRCTGAEPVYIAIGTFFVIPELPLYGSLLALATMLGSFLIIRKHNIR